MFSPFPLHALSLPCSFLHARLRTATLRHDADGQATLLNLLLRNYLHYNLYDQAEKLVSKSVFPEQANNNEWARYLYYTGEMQRVLRGAGSSGCARDWSRREPPGAAGDGALSRDAKPHLVRFAFPKCIRPRVNALPLPGRIKAIQLEYSEARRTMTNALRKAPQHTAVGFKQTVSRNLPCSHGVCTPWGSCPWTWRCLRGSGAVSMQGAQAAHRGGTAARGDPG